ncbi:capsule biosynthesis GfcC family protein [Marinomonas sp. IMCC 4694]|uniref:capsule biosynthesis GfcC family protein n=1 Tax=Marinomonas sp. IMCC 4694 TaxID=2605432 RepID=UPI001652D807|nr:capsule biosynthesis GfcC family protein [Marinomonas sp. IMCC 4694]
MKTPLGKCPVGLDQNKRNLVDEKKRVVVDQLRSLKRADADHLMTQLNALYFVYFEPAVTDLDALRLNETLDIEISRRYWLSLPPRPRHIIVVSANRRTPSILAQQPNADLSYYLKQIPHAKDDQSVWVIQPDRKVYTVNKDEWLDKRVFLAPGATVFLGLRDLPVLYKNLNQQIAHLLSHRLGP